MTPVFAHGVVWADARTPLAAGLGDPSSPVRLVTAGDIAALVSDLPPDTTPGTREDLEGHSRVLVAVIEETAVVPMRFGMVFDDDDELREVLLERHADSLREVLEIVDDCVQMTLKAFYDEEEWLADIVRERSDIAELSASVRDRSEVESRNGRIRLGELVARAVEQRRMIEEDTVLRRLQPIVREARVETPRHERGVLHVHVLVPRSGRERLDATVRELSEAANGLQFRYVGPMAPWSFADLALEAGER
ncbi:MAG TPA: GvpL/GvpF family gas vesicle protein [Baekduia sp.]|nr:GvpL/GvpF family gas vesicle protein [Baekduia sp.]